MSLFEIRRLLINGLISQSLCGRYSLSIRSCVLLFCSNFVYKREKKRKKTQHNTLWLCDYDQCSIVLHFCGWGSIDTATRIPNRLLFHFVSARFKFDLSSICTILLTHFALLRFFGELFHASVLPKNTKYRFFFLSSTNSFSRLAKCEQNVWKKNIFL